MTAPFSPGMPTSAPCGERESGQFINSPKRTIMRRCHRQGGKDLFGTRRLSSSTKSIICSINCFLSARGTACGSRSIALNTSDSWIVSCGECTSVCSTC